MNVRTFLTSLLFIGGSMLYGVLLPMTVHAATETYTATTSQQLPVANVYIHNVTIVNRTSNSFTVFFYIGNGQGAQSDVKYGVQLFQAGPKGSQVLADEYIANDTLSLTSGAPMVGHTLTYTAPAFFSGTYQVWVTAENSNGFPYSAVPAGTVTFTPSVKGYIEIIQPTCLLSVMGDPTHAQYSSQQGVDVLPTEKLIATCQATNHFSTSQAVQPHFETRYRSQYGSVLPFFQSPGATTTLAANKTQTISFVLPNAQVPQAYEVSAWLTDGTGATISNKASFHYVVAGPSGTIQNAILDKNQYGMGDTAHATITWTPSADSFLNSRYGSSTTEMLNIEAVLSAASSSVPCGAPVTVQVPASGLTTTIAMPLTASCINPSLLVTLKDANGNVLDQKTFTVTSPISSASPRMFEIVLAAVIILLILYGVLHTAYTHKKTSPVV